MSITAAALICLSPVAYDGDTVRCGISPARVRLFAIEAPEVNPLQPGALEAKAATQGLSVGGLMCEPKGANFSRLVALCYNSRGQDIGRLLMDSGLVKEWCQYSVSRKFPNGYYGTCTARAWNGLRSRAEP